jgi:hypothetical protein
VAEIRVHREARAELLEAIDYYEEHASRGEVFASAVEDTYSRMMAAPDSFEPTRGARSVRPANAKQLMRHSKIDLTMKHYTDVRLVDLKGDVERLAGGLVGNPVTSTDKPSLTSTTGEDENGALRNTAAPANPAGATVSLVWAIKDSNLRPPACQAGTLAS